MLSIFFIAEQSYLNLNDSSNKYYHLKDLLTPYSDKLKWLVFLIAILCYANTYKHQMALDDYSVIVNHSHVQNGLDGISEIIKTNYRNGNGGFNDGLYRPLSLVMFAIEKEFFNNDTNIAHGINILLYALCCMFLFISLRKIFENQPLVIPLVAALVFVVHPIHTEVVANIKGRDDLLAFFGFVMALFFLLKQHESKSIKHLVSAVFFFVLALLSKESAVSFAVIIPALIFFKEDYKLKNAVNTLLLLLPMSVAFMLLRYSIVNGMEREIDPGNFGLLNNPLAATDNTSLRWGSTFALQITFLQKLIFGSPLIHDYSFNLIPLDKLGSIKSIGGIIALLGLGYLSVLGLLKKNKWGIIAAIYLLSISVASQILLPIGTIFAERLLFISVLPFGIAIAFLAEVFQKKLSSEKAQKTILACGLIALVGYTPQTFRRNSDWENNYTLYESDLEKGKESARINYNFGSISYEESKLNKVQANLLLNQASIYLNRAINIYPEYYDAYNNLGLVYNQLKDYPKGIATIKKAISLNPDYNKFYLNLGLLYFDAKQYEFAIQSFQEYITRVPNSSETYLLLGQAFGNLNQFQKAIGNLEQALVLKPDYLEAYNYLGMAYGFTNQQTKAVKTLRNALQYYPNDSNLLFNLSIALHQMGNYQEEYRVLQQILNLYPNNAAAKRNLELVKALI